jgi:hypothetical protein
VLLVLWLYLAMRAALALLARNRRGPHAKDVELLVLRQGQSHQIGTAREPGRAELDQAEALGRLIAPGQSDAV